MNCVIWRRNAENSPPWHGDGPSEMRSWRWPIPSTSLPNTISRNQKPRPNLSFAFRLQAHDRTEPQPGTSALMKDPVVTRRPEAIRLRESAHRLRAIAATFDHPIVRGDVLRLAEKCEELAKTAETAQRCRDDNC